MSPRPLPHQTPALQPSPPRLLCRHSPHGGAPPVAKVHRRWLAVLHQRSRQLQQESKAVREGAMLLERARRTGAQGRIGAVEKHQTESSGGPGVPGAGRTRACGGAPPPGQPCAACEMRTGRLPGYRSTFIGICRESSSANTSLTCGAAQGEARRSGAARTRRGLPGRPTQN